MPKNIKVLHVLPSLVPAGAERVCHDLLLGLDEKIFSTSLLLFKDNSQGDVFKQNLKQKGVAIFSLRKKCLIDLRNFWQIYRAIKKASPDIVHTHLGGDIYGRLAAYLAGVKIIVSTEHNINQREKWSAAILKKWTIPLSKHIFAVSEAVRQDAILRYNIPSEKISVIYNGINLNNFQNIIHSSNNKETIVIGAMGRLNEQKGFDVLVAACKLTKNQNYQVKIAGQGELKNNLENQITDLNLQDKVFLVGQVEAANFFKEIDIFVLPSRWEGLGLVVLEAAAASRPIIASNVDGVREIINSQTGFLFSSDKPEELAKQIDYLLDNLTSLEVQEKIRVAKELIISKFSLEKMVNDYSNWYQRLIETN